MSRSNNTSPFNYVEDKFLDSRSTGCVKHTPKLEGQAFNQAGRLTLAKMALLHLQAKYMEIYHCFGNK